MIPSLIDIALCRRGPRDLPAGGPVLIAAMVLYVAQSAAQFSIAYSLDGALLAGLGDLVATSAILAAFLALGRRTHRLPQTLLAVIGTETLLAPLVILLSAQLPPAQAPEPAGLVLRLCILAVLVWNLVIVAHILRAAFDATIAVGVLLAAAYGLLSYVMVNLWLVPAAGASGA